MVCVGICLKFISFNLSENLDDSFMNLLFPENEEGEGNTDFNGDSEAEAASSDGINDVDSNAELTPGNTSDEEYERKFLNLVILFLPLN